ncbi:MAG: Fic family protein [Pseudolabrys sp.]|nr:Fic family protein [Pseudolabrys sp.]
MARTSRHPTPHLKLAAALAKLKELQGNGRRVFRSSAFGRSDRERLTKQGFLREVIKGWLISSAPGTAQGDSTPWYASFWQFCALYCESRFGKGWHVSPEQSLLLHAEHTAIPGQVVIYAPKGTNNTIRLLFGTSLYDLKQAQMPPPEELVIKDGLRLFTPAAALTRIPESFFARHPVEVQVVLASIKDSSEVLPRLLGGGHSAIAGRLAGAFRRLRRAAIADDIMKTMKGAGYDLRGTDPFSRDQTFGAIKTGVAPVVGRIQALWESMREPVIAAFPEAPGPPKNKSGYLRFVDEIYNSDAYHSLSIEGYRVTPELIERVREGNWRPDVNESDRQNRDALAARGYWQAFQNVKENVSSIIAGEQPGELVRTAHRDWYRELFQPSVQAGLIGAQALAGYRNQLVFLRGSRHVPPRADALRDAMPALFDLLEKEDVPAVSAVLGHWMFGYIHPYPDGNGRIARFLMNAMLASGGYPWTVIRVEDRNAYLASLESASVEGDIGPFSAFIAERVSWSMKEAARTRKR